jgi:hypothetical protein
MSLKKFGAVFGAFMALGAVLAVSAFATATQPANSAWYVGGAKLSGSTAVKCHSEGNLVLTGSILGEPAEIVATGVECVETKITNEGTKAVDSGKLKFTGTTMKKPAGCSVPTSITTAALKTAIYEEGATVYDKFEPASGTTFVNIPVTGCAFEATAPVTGTVFGKSPNATGVEVVGQKLAFSGAINTTAGGALKFAGAAAALTGTAVNEVTSGAAFGAKEK